ncbi:E3 ubiquitin-protein ligase RNF26 [Cyrtonyx montezumae]|uniref:E3 ubiquitin-protein ligase RNF26 n=1 Tax=Cyrtonyx montezumae TaxID=9017 RepID=UPI0032D9E961
MELLLLLLRGLRLTLDLLLLLLDLNFFLVSSLLTALFWLLAAVASLPGAATAAMWACWNGLLGGLCGLAEAACGLALGAVQGLGSLLRGCCSALEGLKVLGHLLTHLGLRGRELLQRGLCGLLGSGQAVLREAGEGLAIGVSLLAYVVNSVVNLCLLGTQNFFTLLLALWDSVASLVLRVADLLAAFLAHVSSSAIAVSILLWSPCQLAFELLVSTTELLISIFFVNVYGLALLLALIVVSIVIFNPGLLLALLGHVLGYFHTLPAYPRLQQEVRRVYQMAVLMLGMAMTSQTWRRVVNWSLQLTNWSQGGRTMNRDSGQEGAAQALGRLTLARGTHSAAQRVQRPHPALGRSTVSVQHLQAPRDEPSTSWRKASRREQLNTAAEDGAGGPDDDPWVLLKEQEERKKCVICQDQTKTVLLLPCRHLCLCQGCTEVLLQQAVYQRNCPLCRQMIFRTLNVYL